LGLLEDAQDQARGPLDERAQRTANLAAGREIASGFAPEVIEFTRLAKKLGDRAARYHWDDGRSKKGWRVRSKHDSFYLVTGRGDVYFGSNGDQDAFSAPNFTRKRNEKTVEELRNAFRDHIARLMVNRG
jgi:hypothetical protein